MSSLSKRSEKKTIRIPVGERIFYAADDLLMIFLCVLILIPLIHVVAGSFFSPVTLLPARCSVLTYYRVRFAPRTLAASSRTKITSPIKMKQKRPEAS